jgi:hypothetical protein
MGGHKLREVKDAPAGMTPEQQAAIERDRALPVAVEVAAAPLDAQQFGRAVEQAMARLNARAMAAGMVLLNTTQHQSLAYDPGSETVAAVMTILGQWMQKDKLEAMHRQQALMGGAPTPRGRA